MTIPSNMTLNVACYGVITNNITETQFNDIVTAIESVNTQWSLIINGQLDGVKDDATVDSGNTYNVYIVCDQNGCGLRVDYNSATNFLTVISESLTCKPLIEALV